MHVLSRWLELGLARPKRSALAAGLVSALGFEPLHLWPAALLALAALCELLQRARGWRQVAVIGWLFGLGHFTIGNNWIATAFTYQAAMPVWLGWIAVIALACYLAVYPMLATLASWLLTQRLGGRGLVLVPALAGAWIVAESLRGHVFTGYAWNPLAMIALGGFDRPGLALIAPWTGTYALSGIVILLAGTGWLAVSRRRSWIHAGAVLALIVLAFAGPWRGSGMTATGTTAFTLVQPNIPQDELNDPAMFETQFVKTARLTMSHPGQFPAPGERRLVLWPESGVPDYLREGYPPVFYNETTFAADPGLARRRIGQVIGQDSMLLTGTVDLEMRRGKVVGARNAVTALDDAGEIRGSYAKAHLVPYGEYLPLREWLSPLGLARLVPGDIDFWPGPGPRTLDLGIWGKAGVQICYEIVFSGAVVDAAHRPDFLFNPSNDGWFGSWGPPQHLAQARMRAIEEGLPVLRSTTTGISAVIDAHGVVRQHLGRNVAGRLDGMLPAALPPTLFARLGNWLALGWGLALLGLALFAGRSKWRK